MPVRPIIVLFRRDLRLADHPALAAAAATGSPIIPLYVLDDVSPRAWKAGGASRWWLHGSIASLRKGLAELGSRLIMRRGDARHVLLRFAQETKASAVFGTRGYEPWAKQLERDLNDQLEGAGVEFKRFPGHLLFEPEALRTKAGEPFRVFSPFWRAATAADEPKRPLPAPGGLPAPEHWPGSDELEDLDLLPRTPDWAGGLRDTWTPGEAGARTRLDQFLGSALAGYKSGRDYPDRASTSMLSPHLAHGEISPRACWHAAKAAASEHPQAQAGLETYLKELGWREFSYHLLFHWPDLPEQAFRPEFAKFPWVSNSAHLEAWQRGRTGYPIVDAGMRQLWHTGWMHNRVRMVVGSFLVKHLLVPWQDGAAWFWDCLVDADLASNSASWQWIAGCGADAAPYFRIFNPVKQGQTFDARGDYVRRWVPELSELPPEHIHCPWSAPADVLRQAGVRLGETYPKPLVDHAAARAGALDAYQTVKVRAEGS